MSEPRQEINKQHNPHVSMAKFQTLEERFVKDRPELLEALNNMKQQMGEKDFDRYLNHVQNLTVSDERMMIIAGGERRRTFLEAAWIPALKKAFGVKMVRIIGGSSYGSADVF